MNIEELQERLDSLGVNPARYDLGGGLPLRSEGLVLARDGAGWLVKHFERGSWYVLESSTNEEDACEAFLRYASEPYYRS